MAQITLKGNPCETSGELPALGSQAPDFRLVGADLSDTSLATFDGKKKILNIVPSLDTDVCATSARKFNERAGGLEDTVLLVISADLPFASKRFCAAENARLTNAPRSGISSPYTRSSVPTNQNFPASPRQSYSTSTTGTWRTTRR